MDNIKNQKKDFPAIITECLEIKQKNFEPLKARRLLSEFFKEIETNDREITVSLILKTIDELKTAINDFAPGDAAATGKIELIGLLYQIAIEQMTGDAGNELTRDLTFFYLAYGFNEDFIYWSAILLDTIQKNNVEYRATLFALGAAQIFVNQWDKAKESFNRLLEDYPDAAEGYFGLALTYFKLGDTSHFQNALELTRKLAPELGRIIDRLSNKGGFSINDYVLEMNSLNNVDD